MTTDKINLVAPDSSPIVAIKLNDGSTSTFDCLYDKNNKTIMYLLPSGNTAKLLEDGGQHILVDANGKEWASSDIEYHSLGSK